MTEEEIQALAIDSWRLMVANERTIADLPTPKQRSAEAKARHLRSSLKAHIIALLRENGIEMVVYDGKPYCTNYPIRAVNADEFLGEERLVVRETLEPALIKHGQVLHFAKVVLTRPEDSHTPEEPPHVSRN